MLEFVFIDEKTEKIGEVIVILFCGVNIFFNEGFLEVMFLEGRT